MKAEAKELTGLLRIVPGKHRLITVVGAGGKTTLIYLLARELTDAGYKVAVTTTTHMQAEGRYGFRPLGIPCEDGKIKGWDDKLAGLKMQFPNQFEGSGKKNILENKLPEDGDKVSGITQEAFNKMGYQDRVKLFKENPEAYAELSKN